MESIYLFGISTTSLRIKSFIEQHNLYKIEAYIVDDEYKTDSFFGEFPVLSLSEFTSIPNYEKLALFICVAWNNLNNDRKNVYLKLIHKEINIVNLISPFSIIRGEILGKNVFVGDQVCLEVGSLVNDNVFVDHQSFIGTNTVLKQHCYIGAKSMIAGECVVGEQSFIGIHATIFDQVKIGAKCIISGGQVIKRNIADYSVVKEFEGVQIIKQYDKDEIIHRLNAKKNVR